MFPFEVVPLHVFFDVLLGVIETAELEPIDKLALKDAMECLYIGVLLGSSDMCELLLCLQVD